MSSVSASLAFLHAEREQLAEDMARIDRAIEVLTVTVEPRRRGPSVRTRVLDVIEEEDRAWPAHEMLAELERRETPVVGVDPLKRVKTTFYNLASGGLAVLVAPCTVRAAKYTHADTERMKAM